MIVHWSHQARADHPLRSLFPLLHLRLLSPMFQFSMCNQHLPIMHPVPPVMVLLTSCIGPHGLWCSLCCLFGVLSLLPLRLHFHTIVLLRVSGTTTFSMSNFSVSLMSIQNGKDFLGLSGQLGGQCVHPLPLQYHEY